MKEKLQLKTDDANPVKIVLADGRTHLGFRASLVPLAIGTYKDKLEFLTAPISYDVILGLPWLMT